VLTAWFGHRHAQPCPLHRLPAGVKLGTALVIIVGTVLVPADWRSWYVGVAGFLFGVAWWSRIPPLFLLRRLLVLSPFVLGVVAVNAVQVPAPGGSATLLARSALCLLTVVLLANTTPFGQTLAVLRRVRAPAVLVTTVALMHRYLYVLLEESERMRRARASRTLRAGRRAQWRLLGTMVGHLFVRASERAERIYASMCARGWK
jgi:cobalt/nickel transport system permease protein